MEQQIAKWLFILSKKSYLKSKKEKKIWKKNFISLLLEQKNNENFTPYSFEEIEKDAKLDIALEESLFISFCVIICLLLLVKLIKFLLFVLNLPQIDIYINNILDIVAWGFFFLFIYITFRDKVLTKATIEILLKYFNYYKINKIVLMFLLEKHLTDIQNNIFFLININKYKLNREKPKPKETKENEKENEEPSTNEDNGNLNSIKSFS